MVKWVLPCEGHTGRGGGGGGALNKGSLSSGVPTRLSNLDPVRDKQKRSEFVMVCSKRIGF